VAAHLGRTPSFSGGPFDVTDRSAAEHLAVARPGLEDHARAVETQLAAGHRPVSVNGRRCVVGYMQNVVALFDLRTGRPKSLPAYRPVETYPIRVEADEVKLEL
jgi:hypothetical protein